MTAVNVAKSFSASTKKLSAVDRGRVLDFLTKFLDDPASPGLNFESVNGAGDGMKSARISRDLRTIVHQTKGLLTLLYAAHHEEAYRWAEGRRVEFHPVTGTLQVVETNEVAEAVLDQTPPSLETTGTFDSYEENYLLSLGIPEDWLPTVRRIANDDQLLTVATRLPEEVAERLLALASGEMVTPPPPASPDEPLERNPENLRRFWVVQDAGELAEVLERPLEDWVRYLHPSQRRLVTAEFNGPAKVSGAAGTGKTVVGMHRARALATAGKRVLLTSFVTTLCQNMERNVRLLCAGMQREPGGAIADRITISTVHKQALDVAKRVNPSIRPVGDGVVASLIERHHRRGGFLFDASFLLDEWNGVLELQGLTTWDEYRDATRAGRGKPLTVKQRKGCWAVFGRVIDDLHSSGALPWSMICRAAREAVEHGSVESPFDAVIVDEVQDLRPQDLLFLASLAAEHPGDLMLLGDAGQRIYPGGYSLKRLGIDVRGRSHVLRVNYRTTEQIRLFADRLLPTAGDDLDEGRENRRSNSLLQGPKPTLQGLTTESEQDKFVVKMIQRIVGQGIAPGEIAIFARTGRHLDSVLAALDAAAIPTLSLNRDSDLTESAGVNLGTMHRAKGLEFKVVFIVHCGHGVVPHSYTLGKIRDQGDYEAAVERERRLLYVAATRARDELFVSWIGRPSEFLPGAPGSQRKVS